MGARFRRTTTRVAQPLRPPSGEAAERQQALDGRRRQPGQARRGLGRPIRARAVVVRQPVPGQSRLQPRQDRRQHVRHVASVGAGAR